MIRMCTTHWDKLRAALTARGMDRFIAQTPEALAAKSQPGLSDAEAFEALLGAHNAILMNTTPIMGLAGLTGEAEVCPICFLKAQPCNCGDPKCSERFEGWIENAANDAVTRAKELGLIGAS